MWAQARAFRTSQAQGVLLDDAQQSGAELRGCRQTDEMDGPSRRQAGSRAERRCQRTALAFALTASHQYR